MIEISCILEELNTIFDFFKKNTHFLIKNNGTHVKIFNSRLKQNLDLALIIIIHRIENTLKNEYSKKKSQHMIIKYISEQS